MANDLYNLAGRTLGRYQLTEKLGAGGMADVYKAYDPQLNRHVAIKVISPTLNEGEAIPERFSFEARSLAAFSHPNIVQIYDYGEEDGAVFLVMEYINGGTLEQLTGRPVDPQEAARWLAPIARALSYAHANKVVHRDVKPANILLRDGQPVLSDFGISKLFDQTRTLTKATVGFGTPHYMSPEQCRGDEVDPRTDVYSLGIVLFELITGRPPFQADTPWGVGIKQVQEPPPRLSEAAPWSPEEAQGILDRALAKNPEARYASMEAMAEDLERLAHGGKQTKALRTGLFGRPARGERRPQTSQPTLPQSGPPIGEGGETLWPGGAAAYPDPAPVQSPLWPPARPQAPPRRPNRMFFLLAGLVGLCLLVGIASALIFWPSLIGRTQNGGGEATLNAGEPAATLPTQVAGLATPLSGTAGVPAATAPVNPAPTQASPLAPTQPPAQPTQGPNPAGSPEEQIEAFFISYFEAINTRSYQTSWQMLSDNFKATGENRDQFDLYVDWWNTFERVDVLGVTVHNVDPAQGVANATVRLRYFPNDRDPMTEEYTYRLVYNEALGHWQIDL